MIEHVGIEPSDTITPVIGFHLPSRVLVEESSRDWANFAAYKL